MRGDEDVNEDQLANNYGDEPYDDTPTKRKRGRPKGSTKTTNKKPKAELAEGETKLKMGRAWYAVNDQKREFRYFTGLQEGEVPCSKKEEKEVKRRLNGYTRLLSNGRSKIAIFEDVDKDQQDQELGQHEQPGGHYEGAYQTGGEYQQEYYHHAEGGEYNPQDYQNHQQMYQQAYQNPNGEGQEYNQNIYQGEYQTTDGSTYDQNAVYHQQDPYNQNAMYQGVQTHDYSNMQQHYGQVDYQQPQQDLTNYHKPEKNEEDDDEEYQPEGDEDYAN